MTSSSVTATKPPGSDAWFCTTHWSVVLSTRQKDSRSAEALEALCQTYWYPLYAYVRRLGHNPHDAEDLTQEFFARFIEKGCFQAADPEKGRFRTFVLIVLKRFLANEWEKSRAQKRGGNRTHVCFDTEFAERKYQVEPASPASADAIYERRWALTLIEQTIAQLRREFEEAGKGAEFELLRKFLTADKASINYAQLAADLGSNEGTARVAVHRMRRRYRDVFRQVISRTVASPEEVEDEIRHLMSVLRG